MTIFLAIIAALFFSAVVALFHLIALAIGILLLVGACQLAICLILAPVTTVQHIWHSLRK